MRKFNPQKVALAKAKLSLMRMQEQFPPPKKPKATPMTAKANQVGTKLDAVLDKVDKAADAASKDLDDGTNELVDALGLASNLGKNFGSIGSKIRERLAPLTNNPPEEPKKKGLF